MATEAAGEAGGLPEPASTAEAVENALFNLFGEFSITMPLTILMFPRQVDTTAVASLIPLHSTL